MSDKKVYKQEPYRAPVVSKAFDDPQPKPGHDLEITVKDEAEADTVISILKSYPGFQPSTKQKYVYCCQWQPGVELRDFKHYGADQDQAKWTPAWDNKCWFGGNNLVFPGQYCLILTDGSHVVARTEAELNELYEKA